MFKKLVSFLSLWAILWSVFAVPAFAANIQAPLIQSVTLTVQNSTPQTFEPSAGQVLKTAVAFDTNNFGQQLATSTGYARVIKGTTVIKNLTTWTNTNLPQSIADWDGKAIENTPEAQLVCGNQGAVCPDGDYKIEVRVEYSSGSDKIFDLKTQDFKVYTTPAVAITNLTVSPNSFNPLSQTADISFNISNNGFITVEVFDGTTVKKTLVNNESINSGAVNKTVKPALAWDGKDAQGQLLTNKTYSIKVTSRQSAGGAVLDTKTVDVTVNTPSSITISSFNLTPTPVKAGGTFDPSPSGDNQDLQVDYALNQAPDDVQVVIKNPKGDTVKTMSLGSGQTGTAPWDGLYALKIVTPGVYTATLTATKSGSNPASMAKTFTVAYSNSNKGDIQNLTVSPDSFDPDFEDAVIEFTNTKDTNLTVGIQNPTTNGKVRTFSGYQDTNYGENKSHSIAWNGKDDSGNDVTLATYKVVVEARNNYGVVVAEKNVTVNNSGGSVSSSNSHITDISFSPSSKFEPAKDDELRIRFDVEQKLDSLKIYAIRGAKKIELFNETDVDIENNVEVNWDGRDQNDDYADKGSWKIQFESKVGSTQLLAAKTITVEYEKPGIDDFFISKTKFDQDQGEFTYIIFRTDLDADVTIKLLESNSEQDDLVEDMEVTANTWYAVSWDGDNYNYDDDLDLKLLAQNKANHDVFDSGKISVDLAEDKVSSSKSNVTQDYIDPAITDGYSPMTIYYNLEDQADVTITVHKGESGSGSKVIDLAAIDEQEGGSHSVSWNGLDNNGKKLSTGLYTYKIISGTNGGTDTETGIFVVGNVGNVEGSSSSSSGTVKSSGGKVSPNVIVDGGVSSGGGKTEEEAIKKEDTGDTDTGSKSCAGFPDVSKNSKYCPAIEWVKEAGIFKGYPDGTFGASKPINRAELLKVILEAFDIQVSASVSGNLGFKDVDVSAWYMPYIKAAKDKGIFQGDGGKGTARPGDTSVRVESLKMIFESMKTVGLLSQIVASCSNQYGDVSGNAWYQKYVCQADAFSLIDQNEDGNFYPGMWSTRGEIAEIFYRLHLLNFI